MINLINIFFLQSPPGTRGVCSNPDLGAGVFDDMMW
jgi:hypothetical protein